MERHAEDARTHPEQVAAAEPLTAVSGSARSAPSSCAITPATFAVLPCDTDTQTTTAFIRIPPEHGRHGACTSRQRQSRRPTTSASSIDALSRLART